MLHADPHVQLHLRLRRMFGTIDIKNSRNNEYVIAELVTYMCDLQLHLFGSP